MHQIIIAGTVFEDAQSATWSVIDQHPVIEYGIEEQVGECHLIIHCQCREITVFLPEVMARLTVIAPVDTACIIGEHALDGYGISEHTSSIFCKRFYILLP